MSTTQIRFCSMCLGSGKAKSLGTRQLKCLFCDGSGWQIFYRMTQEDIEARDALMAKLPVEMFHGLDEPIESTAWDEWKPGRDIA